MKYLAAIFDQDGLLFDTEKIYQASWVESGRLQGVDIDPAFPRQFCGVGRRLIAEMSAREYPQLDIEKYCDTAVSLAWEKQLSSVPELKPGTVEILKFCREHGIRTAVASSSSRRVVEHNLSSTGLIEYFDAIVTGDEITNTKPAPDIFLLAAKRVGVEPKKCCVFEDAFSGIIGANAAGMSAVMIPDQRLPTDEIRPLCHIFPSLLEAIDELRL